MVLLMNKMDRTRKQQGSFKKIRNNKNLYLQSETDR